MDVSNNQLDSVFRMSNSPYLRLSLLTFPELACLKNLKELKVDGNAITDLSGIADLDGLVKLSVANNQIERLDFGRTKWWGVKTSGRLNVTNLAGPC